MAVKEIEKLRERVDKDPNSKLFVPLAEEYRKEGMLDEAIDVLQKGLERQPSYMSARVSLGKIYLEKGMSDEARVEFENVIKVIPDNLYAHKKLSEIYRDTGKRDLALKAFRTVLKLNPMDEETLNNLRDLEGASGEQPVGQIQEAGSQISEEAAAVEEASPFGEISLEEAFTEQEEPVQFDEEVDSFKDSLFGLKAETDEAGPEDVLAIEEGMEEAEEMPAEVEEGWSFGEVEGSTDIEALEERMETVTEAAKISEGMLHAESTSEPVLRTPEGKRELLQTADRYIEGGNYIGAIELYQKMLVAVPGDKSILQRIEELRALLKLMGKDKEILIAKLNAFLNAVKKRGDEFFRSS